MITQLSRVSIFTAIACAFAVTALPNSVYGEGTELNLRLRSREETSAGSGRFHILHEDLDWNSARTAVIVCDMWDLHHCLNATRRGAELAPRMNEVLKKLRGMGGVIIHAPSSCMEFYKDHPARLRAAQVPRAEQLPPEIGQWCRHIPEEEQGTYPIDQSDGGEDDDPEEHRQWAEKLAAMGRNPKAPWIRQTELLDIDDGDYISDSGEEIWSILAHHDINNVILLGVHTNMCVLGRPFGLRNMARYGKNVVLMRDMTDTMYNPARAPYVSHFTGTDLIVEHIEKWVCPTISSEQILGGKPFRFSTDTRPRVLIVCSEPEYKTEQTLPPLALHDLGKDFQATVLFGADDDGNRIPALTDLIEDADVLFVSVRRRALPNEQLEAIRRHVAAGKAVVGIRTANHAFSLRGEAPPEGHATWETWDQDVFGGNYTGHHGNDLQTAIRVADGAEQHPILKELHLSSLMGHGSLYLVSPLAEKTTPLLIGSIPDKPAEPVAWTSTTSGGGRAFYTSLGHVDDFQQPAFRQLLIRALAWAAGQLE